MPTFFSLTDWQVNTYVAHPWVFQDAVTHESLNANSKNVFEPGPWYEVSASQSFVSVAEVNNHAFFFQQYIPELRSGRLQPQDIQPKRVTVNITSPLYTLKDTAMKAISCRLHDAERIRELELPRQLEEELAALKKATGVNMVAS